MESQDVLDKIQVTRFIAAVAVLHGCRLVGIDFSRSVIDISGDCRSITECINELHRAISAGPVGLMAPVTYRFH